MKKRLKHQTTLRRETEASINQTFEEVFNQGKDFAKCMGDYFKDSTEKKADSEEWSEFEETEDTRKLRIIKHV